MYVRAAVCVYVGMWGFIAFHEKTQKTSIKIFKVYWNLQNYNMFDNKQINRWIFKNNLFIEEYISTSCVYTVNSVFFSANEWRMLGFKKGKKFKKRGATARVFPNIVQITSISSIIYCLKVVCLEKFGSLCRLWCVPLFLSISFTARKRHIPPYT